MLGRKKKRQGSVSSVDLLGISISAPVASGSGSSTTFPSSSSSIPIPSNGNGSIRTVGVNHWVERVRGAVGFGGRNRTISDDAISYSRSSPGGGGEAMSSSPTGSVKGFFGRGITSTSEGANHRSTSVGAKPQQHPTISFPTSASTSDLLKSNGGGGGFFARATTTSMVSKPSWLTLGSAGARSSPLTASPSSPTLSLQAAEGSMRKEDREAYIENGTRLLKLNLASMDSNENVPFKRGFSHSVEDLLIRATSPTGPPTSRVSSNTRRSIDGTRIDQSSRRDGDDTIKNPLRSRNNRQSISPAMALSYISSSANAQSKNSSSLSTSAPSVKSNRNGTSFRKGVEISSPQPFPTSVSTPNFPPQYLTPTEDRRRDSQTIVCQGFLQRKGDYVPPPISPIGGNSYKTHSPSASGSGHKQLFPLSSSSLLPSPTFLNPGTSPLLRPMKSEADLQKGWKPYRVILKGSKLYLHKLPADLSTTAKQLFPTSIVAEPEEAISPIDVPKFDDSLKKRQRRAFWGTGASHHPGLIVDKGKGKERVGGGTLEALLHELVFASCFSEDGDDRTAYNTFLETLLLIWPFLPFSSSQSASELDRCSGLAVRTALEAIGKDPEGSKAPTVALTIRLKSIVQTICERYPEDLRSAQGQSDWKAALQELVKQLGSLPSEGEEGAVSELLSQAYAARPALQAKLVTEWTSSRPMYSRAGSSSSTSGSPSRPRKHTTTDVEHSSSMTTHTFLGLDPLAFAAQIHLFHLDRLAAITGNHRAERSILCTASGLLAVDKQTAITSLFSFSATRPHFLSRMVAHTLFPSTNPSTSFFSSSPAPIDLRATVITRWIVVGEELRRIGDMAGWMAISFALCCRAISRLEDSWRLVEEDKAEIVRREWAPTLAALGFVDFEDVSIAPLGYEGPDDLVSSIPYLGSILEDTMNALGQTAVVIEDQPGAVSFEPFYRLREKLAFVAAVWQQSTLVALKTRPDVDLQCLFQNASRTLPPANAQLNSYMAASLEVEPRPLGVQPFITEGPRLASDPSPLIPLFMVEPLPYISLIDRDKIIASATPIPKKLSASNLPGGSSGALPDAGRKVSPAGLSRHNSYPPSVAPAVERVGNFARLRSEIASTSDTLIRFADGDLVFRIVSTAAPLMPPPEISNERGILSRTSSWIESRSSRGARLGRTKSEIGSTPPSPARGGSPVSSRTLEPPLPKLQVASEEEPVSVILKAGTIETLVDLLILGVDNLKTPTTDADGELSLADRRPLRLDSDEFRHCFFATFRSFSSPIVLLDMLRKRYLAAPSASLESINLSSARPFPSWSTMPVDETELDWSEVAKIRMAILESFRFWADHHMSDFLDDGELFNSSYTFITFVESTEESYLLERPDEDGVLELVRSLKLRFSRGSLRPVVRSRRAASSNPVAESSDEDVEFSFDGLAAEDLIDRLDQIACEITRDVTENDLLRYAEVVEMSTLANSIALYSSRQLAKVDDEDIIIADPYSHLRGIGADPIFLQKMPSSLQHGLRVHTIIRKWILAHLVEPDILLSQRKLRMVKTLDMIQICRSRMGNVLFGGVAEAQTRVTDATLASFVERAVISAVVAPESRLFAAAWNGVSTARGCLSCDSLIALVKTDLILTDRTATLDLAWLNERLVEISTQLDNFTDGISINFDKRRWLYNCVKNALAIRPASAKSSADSLRKMETKLLGWGNWTIRTLREASNAEGSKIIKAVKPFSRLVAQQQEKIRRDKQIRELVVKGLKIKEQGRAQREKEVAKAMDKSVSTVRTRRMTAIFRPNRPLSSLNTSQSSLPSLPSSHSLQALNDWIPTVAKPYLVLALSGVQVLPLENGPRSYVFELRTEDGQRSLFQASSSQEMSRWTKSLVGSGTQIAFRRATFLAQTPMVEEPEESVPSTLVPTKPRSRGGIFAVPLWDLLQREESAVPEFIIAALELIEAKGLLEQGLYRLSGENRVVNEFKDALNSGRDAYTLLVNTDVHNITGLVKLYLRELPDPLLTHKLYDEFVVAASLTDYDNRLYAIRDLVWKLPQHHFLLLRRLAEHLDKVTDNEEVNAMHAENLAVVFAPTLLQPAPGPSAFATTLSNLGIAMKLTKILILQQAWIFGEAENDVGEVVEVDAGIGSNSATGETNQGEDELVEELREGENAGAFQRSDSVLSTMTGDDFVDFKTDDDLSLKESISNEPEFYETVLE